MTDMDIAKEKQTKHLFDDYKHKQIFNVVTWIAANKITHVIYETWIGLVKFSTKEKESRNNKKLPGK